MKQIPLTQDQVAFVDDDVFEVVGRLNWYASRSLNTWYAGTNLPRCAGKQQTVKLHQVILGYPLHRNEIDHIDGNGLNCVRENMRIVSHRVNCYNRRKTRLGLTSSQHPGIYWHKSTGKWMARIRIGKVRKYLGHFVKEEDAAKAYQEAIA